MSPATRSRKASHLAWHAGFCHAHRPSNLARFFRSTASVTREECQGRDK
jgi:hypothetical protein